MIVSQVKRGYEKRHAELLSEYNAVKERLQQTQRNLEEKTDVVKSLKKESKGLTKRVTDHKAIIQELRKRALALPLLLR